MTEHPRLDSIGNRYEIRSRIGEGGMGTVYKAHDSLLEIDVAIKKLHKNDSADAAVRFQNEAVALGKLNHPNIARILDFANDADNLYMVMEYLEGKSLSELTHNNTIFTVKGPLTDNSLWQFQENRWLKEVYFANCTSPIGSLPLRYFADSRIKSL